MQILNTGDEYFLEISDTTIDNAGQYSCTATNKAGSVSSAFKVNVREIAQNSNQIDYRSVIKTPIGKVTNNIDHCNNNINKQNSINNVTDSSDQSQQDFRAILSKRPSDFNETRRSSSPSGVNQVDFRGVLNRKISKQSSDIDSDSRSDGSIEQCDFRNVLKPPKTLPKPNREMRTEIQNNQNGLGEAKDLKRKPLNKDFSIETDLPEYLPSKGRMDFRNTSVETKQKPVVGRNLSDITVTEGNRAVLECEVTGVPSPDIGWTHNGEIIKPSKFFQMTYEKNVARLVIAEAFAEDEGEYVCLAKNAAGSCDCYCSLFVEGKNKKQLLVEFYHVTSAEGFFIGEGCKMERYPASKTLLN